MVENFLTMSSKTSRGALDLEKVLLLKSMILKSMILKHFILIKSRFKSYCFIDYLYSIIYKYSFAMGKQDKGRPEQRLGMLWTQGGPTLDGSSV